MKFWYKGNQIDLRMGDIILFRNNFMLNEPITWLSAAIRLFTGSKYNHCAIVAVNADGEYMINEAVGKGVISRPLSLHLNRTDTEIMVIRHKQSIEKYARVNHRAMKRVGTPYDIVSLVFYQLIYRLTGWWLDFNRKDDKRSMVCSEYCAWCYNLPKWYLYSVKEFISDSRFDIAYQEIPYVNEAERQMAQV